MRIAPILPVAALLAAPAYAAEKRSYMLTQFDRVRIEGPYEVRLTTGRSAGGEAEGDIRDLEQLVVRVEGMTLRIRPGTASNDGWRKTGGGVPRITIRVPQLRTVAITGAARVSIDAIRSQRIDLALSGAGQLSANGIAADQLNAALTGTGRMTLAGQALRATFLNNGAGTIDAAALIAGDLTVRAASSGDSSFAARNTARIESNGVGAIRVAGDPTCTVNAIAPVACGRER